MPVLIPLVTLMWRIAQDGFKFKWPVGGLEQNGEARLSRPTERSLLSDPGRGRAELGRGGGACAVMAPPKPGARSPTSKAGPFVSGGERPCVVAS